MCAKVLRLQTSNLPDLQLAWGPAVAAQKALLFTSKTTKIFVATIGVHTKELHSTHVQVLINLPRFNFLLFIFFDFLLALSA